MISIDHSNDGPNPPAMPLCERVRRSCAAVSENATLVTIDAEGLDRVADQLAPRLPEPSTIDDVRPELAESEIDQATLVLALDAINFGSGWHDIVRKRPGRSGAQTMWDALTEYVSWTGPLGPDRLRAFTVEDCSQIFGQELDGGALEELMSLFATAFHDLGDWLDDNGGVATIVGEAGGSAETLAERLTDMLFYRDTELHDSGPVAFYKRAQITPADLARTLRADLFGDLAQLTAFADNLVPHTLRMLGALRMDPDLADAIEHGVLLEPGATPEVEIRATGVHAVELLVERTGAKAMDIDAALWEAGQDPSIKATPRHRARSVFY